ncbi:hypothetical protein R1sor_024802 [Riccia sorocarpa]|uniref:Lectin n=1 Tax=Riccia sorocarpa TaxID=122646 RepID=A0ABD3GT41_9MARC
MSTRVNTANRSVWGSTPFKPGTEKDLHYNLQMDGTTFEEVVTHAANPATGHPVVQIVKMVVLLEKEATSIQADPGGGIITDLVTRARGSVAQLFPEAQISQVVFSYIVINTTITTETFIVENGRIHRGEWSWQ